MPELRPDEARLGLQGQVSQLTSPPPMPQVNTFVPNAENSTRGQFGAMTSRLGDVISAQALEQQRLTNQAMISNALLSAQSAMADSFNRQTQRKGFNVGKIAASDTADAQDDIVTEFSRDMSQIVSSINGKFTNDYQREMFNRAFAPQLVAKTDDIQQYFHQQWKDASLKSLDANLNMLSNDAVGYIGDGDLDKAEMTINIMRDTIRDTTYSLGGSGADAQYAFDQRINQVVGGAIATLNQEERYDEMVQLTDRFGVLLTGETRNRVMSVAGSASALGQSKQIAQSVFEGHQNDAGARDPATGLFVQDYFVNLGQDATQSISYTRILTQGHGFSGSSLDNDGSTSTAAFTYGILGGEGHNMSDAQWSAESPDAAFGMWQIIPSTWDSFAPRAGLEGVSLKDATPEQQTAVKNEIIRYGLEKGFTSPEAFAVFYFAGESTAYEWMKDPDNPKWDAPSDGVGQSVNGYIAKFMEGYNSYFTQQGVSSGRKPAPTYNMPMMDMYDTGLQNTEPGIKSTLPYVGGIITSILGTTDGVMISGGARTPAQNAATPGASSTSWHLRGNAVDIVLPDSTTTEEQQQIVDALKATGMYDEVLYHDAGTGLHLHVAGYRGGLETWLQSAGYAPVGGTASYQTKRTVAISPQQQRMVTSTIVGDVQRKNREILSYRANQENMLMGQSWTSREALRQRIAGIPDWDGRQMPVQVQRDMEQRIWAGRANAASIYDAQQQRQEIYQNAQWERFQRSQQEQAFSDAYDRAYVDGTLPQNEQELRNSQLWKNASPSQQRMMLEATRKGIANEIAGQNSQIDNIITSRVKQKYDNIDDPVIHYTIKDEVARKTGDYISQYGKPPSPQQIEQWVQSGLNDSATYNSTSFWGNVDNRGLPDALGRRMEADNYTFGEKGQVYYRGNPFEWNEDTHNAYAPRPR